jgi:hypothetical protein
MQFEGRTIQSFKFSGKGIKCCFKAALYALHNYM